MGAVRAASLRWLRSLPGPVVATPALMSMVTGAFYVSGGLLALIVTFLGGGKSHLTEQRMVAGTALCIGLMVALLPHRQAWGYHVLSFVGTGLITVMVILTGGGDSAEAVAILYVFVTLESFFFFPWQLGLVYQLLAVVGIVLVTAVFDVLSLPVAVGLIVIQTATGWVVGWLVRAAGDAELDSISGLPNRRGFERVLSSEVTKSQRHGTFLALAFLDLDHFKVVNDTGGHSAGDRLLRAAAETWSERLPVEAVLARVGGDEFAVLLPGLGLAEAVELVETLRHALKKIGHGCSAGVASYSAGLSNSSLMGSADVALYQAKRAGRGRTCAYQASDSDQELRRALEAGELFVVFQPVVELRTRRVTGAEALLRWQHPVRGVVPPDEFIPLAEATGLICALGKFVLEEACKTAMAWASPTARIAVNVSGPELLQADYVSQVRNVLATTGLPPTRLVLEVTETSIGADADMSMRTLSELRELGVRIAVDDFGVGYSSLSRLDRLPVDVLKLDRSFVTAIPADGSDAPLIAAVAALATAVGLETVAEGIEQPYQARLLARYGFTEGQGYLFGRPQAAELLRLTSLATLPPSREASEAFPLLAG
ncbi:MAG: diguanylate cyclase/phosphodiesterase [Mycobacterium sp.]|nr:diguanylate cyclase/phosphodiesterase [Mycobacterium sp.]